MIYIFEDGRTLYGNEFLTATDKGKYIEVEALPEIPPKEGKVGYLRADLQNEKVIIEYMDYVEPEEPETVIPPPPEPTNAEIKELLLASMMANLDIYKLITEQQNKD